ncbi:DUF6286 domain-containing protein [Haloechinothrix sp. LS1_15]|uniref:DUF6286 domain-containing protein n=1 Tax=Haloechinothrix sp. LS1_15 TaxID=2652248 RepID=UPI002945183F|nr:DUF6286 domain-containing protein [Haloechinothrix sp. LS1_15]MDV6011397.1 hypothetical protein [Haloechinothrix sp. LS1_15]
MRVAVRLFSILLAMAVVVAGVLLAVETSWRWLRPGEAPLLVPWTEWRAGLAELTWEATPVRLTAIAALALGVVLVLLAATARIRTVPFEPPKPEVSASTTPRSLARALRHHIEELDGVDSVSVSATARKVRVSARSRFARPAELRPRLHEAVTTALAGLPLQKRPRVVVAVRGEGGDG